MKGFSEERGAFEQLQRCVASTGPDEWRLEMNRRPSIDSTAAPMSPTRPVRGEQSGRKVDNLTDIWLM